MFDELLSRIRSGEVPPGERLPTEKELTAQLGVSRTCVREAFKSLQALGLITVRPKVGAIVQSPSSGALAGADQFSRALHTHGNDVITEFRRIIEVGLVSLAAEKANEEDLQRMADSLARYEAAMRSAEAPFQADIEFHRAIAIAARNPIAVTVFDTMVSHIREQLQLENTVAEQPDQGLRDHRRILAAIRRRRPEAARAAMRAHLQNAERYYSMALAGSAPAAQMKSPAS